MGAYNLFSKSFHPFRTHLVADPASKSSFQAFFEHALGKTREFLRVFCKNKNDIAADNFRHQFRLPVESIPKGPNPTFAPHSKFPSYRPGFISEATSKWVTDSLVGALSKEARKKAFQGARGPMLCFVGFGLAKKSSLLKDEEELEGVSYGIREAFSTIPLESNQEEESILQAYHKQFSFSDLKIGKMIAKGCNAAVYSACLAKKSEQEVAEEKEDSVPQKNSYDSSSTKLFISHSEGEENLLAPNESEVVPLTHSTESFDYNLAVKVMFNYSAESNAYAIWRAMYKEVLPARINFSLSDFNWPKQRKNKLKPHPNLVEIYFAFADQLPLLPGACTNYPQALPLRLMRDGCGRNMTLFLVMKRYDCSLKDYLKTYDVSPHTALVLLAQLLEALVHLLQNEIAHRDLKTDNILLDLSDGVASPRLAITDFGCCLESLQLSYSSPEIEKGGNMALMAPEVVSAEAGAFTVIDYSRADLWAAGTLAYEIFGGSNPFDSSKSSLKNFCYTVDSLPRLSPKAPPALQKLIREILHPNPAERPSPAFAATVCQVLLLGPPSLSECHSPKDLQQAVLEWMFLMSAQTFLEASLQSSESSKVDLELRHTFCSRIQYLDVLNAVKYIADA